MSDCMEEAPRADPGFRVYVEGPDGQVDVTHAVMDVYDIAINSMDFGSGFLSTEEVGNLRALGNAIHAERFDYQHDKCLRCAHDYERHYPSRNPACVGERISFPSRGERREEHCSCAGFVKPA